MEKGIRIALGILCLPLLGLGLAAMFHPAAVLVKFAVEPQGAAGLNTIRGVMGSILLGSGIFMVLGLKTKNTFWFFATAILMFLAAFGRIVGVALDGFDSHIMPPLVIELVVGALALTAHKKFGSK
jgi:hypothetical protein